jgi:hypothetical protein
MREEGISQCVKIRVLSRLDELIGKFVTLERPEVHWEDSGSNFRFDSVEEALDAMHDPHLGEHVRAAAPDGAFVLKEVKEFRCYSSDIAMAWEAVGFFDVPLHVRHAEGQWIAAFDGSEPVAAVSAPVAICCAALRAKGIEIEFEVGLLPEQDEHAREDILDFAAAAFQRG